MTKVGDVNMGKSSKIAAAQSSSPVPFYSDAGPMSWLRSEIDRLFEDFRRPTTGMFKFASQFSNPIPAIEMIDGDKEYRLSAELPGMTEKDVEIAVADGMLTISGEKKEESERKDDGCLVSERRYGSFKRQIALPADVRPDAIKARFTNGVLNVTLGKDKNAPERLQKIPIES